MPGAVARPATKQPASPLRARSRDWGRRARCAAQPLISASAAESSGHALLSCHFTHAVAVEREPAGVVDEAVEGWRRRRSGWRSPRAGDRLTLAGHNGRGAIMRLFRLSSGRLMLTGRSRGLVTFMLQYRHASNSVYNPNPAF
jgi:hypothetical protein